LKGLRKEAMFFGCYARDYLLNNVAEKLNIPLYLLRYAYHQEMEDVILNNEISEELLKERFKNHIYYYEEGSGKKILTGDDAQNFIKSLTWRKFKIDKKIPEIKGMCASPGKAKGKVSVINVPSDMAKMQRGNILVSDATNPNLMPAIRKAAAIVTNVGGITCHAAIVSRELKIPCLIGAKFATKILHDGDMIEVDASNGIVIKL
ncbi:MAG: PEP-utilizing enzyme, partial [bacterium]